MDLKPFLKATLARHGFELRRSPLVNPGEKRMRLIELTGVQTVLDVGANIGQYASEVRANGYKGRIVSFEPLPDAFEKLQKRGFGDPEWTMHKVALGALEGELDFNVSADSVCSSPLPTTSRLTEAIPQAGTVARITVPVQRLDDLTADLPGPLLLKIDTQGFEHMVLSGAVETIKRVSLLEIEMALIELYEGGSTIYDLLPRLRAEGFHAVSVANGYVAPSTMQAMDVDLLMVRDET